jgi:hypothetical protein
MLIQTLGKSKCDRIISYIDSNLRRVHKKQIKNWFDCQVSQGVSQQTEDKRVETYFCANILKLMFISYKVWHGLNAKIFSNPKTNHHKHVNPM